MRDPLKPGLNRYDDDAFNVDTPAHWLDDPITPVDRFFVRNNGRWPEALPDDPDAWALAVTGAVDRPRTLSLRQMKEAFETVSVTAVLECAGNWRGALDPPVSGVPWSRGAVGCARFEGFRLADVLAQAGLRPEAAYTAHYSPDRTSAGEIALSRGLPIWKALRSETLLAFAMNGEPLRPEHGAPLRVVAPGFPGSSWQKWIERLVVRDREHDGPGMTGTDYRLPVRPIRPGEPLDGVAFAVIEDMPVKALITAPAEGASIDGGAPAEIRGWAWCGHGAVDHVDVSVDAGATWRRAALDTGDGPWAWRRFRLPWRPDRAGPALLMARATDDKGRTQPLDQAWNPRGYCNNGCHRLAVSVR